MAGGYNAVEVMSSICRLSGSLNSEQHARHGLSSLALVAIGMQISRAASALYALVGGTVMLL